MANRSKQLDRLLSIVILFAVGSLFSSSDLPTGGSVVGGTAGISSTPDKVTVTQSTDRAIVNWNKFNVSHGKEFRSVQPGNGSVLFNRVVGGNPSYIAGKMTAVTPDGRSAGTHIVVSNGAGITVGGGAVFDANGVVLTTRDVRNADFMSGSNSFSGSSDAAITIAGDINVARRGSWISFVGSSVAHTEGQFLAAPFSKIVLAGAEAFSLNLDGADGLVEFVPDPSKASRSLAVQLVRSTSINAENGYVLLQTQDVHDAVSGTISVDGVVESSRAVKGEGGVIRLLGGEGASVNVGGALRARAPPGADTRGGTIHVTGDDVNISDSATLDVSGDKGGGRIHIGGIIGADSASRVSTSGISYRDANDVYIGAAYLSADAIDQGDGGVVDMWANDHLTFGGITRARGGTRGGNGGRIETSSPNPMDRLASFSVDTRAPLGKMGTYTIDPQDIEIGADSGSGAHVVAITTLLTDLTTTNVTLDTETLSLGVTGGTHSITLNSPLGIPDSTAGELTLSASGDIDILSPLSHEGSGLLEATAGGSLNINASVSNHGTGGMDLYGIGGVSIQNQISNSGSGDLNISAYNPNEVNISSSELTFTGVDSGLSLTGSGNITLVADTYIDIRDIGTASGEGGDASQISLTGSGDLYFVSSMSSIGEVYFIDGGAIDRTSHTGLVLCYWGFPDYITDEYSIEAPSWNVLKEKMTGVDVYYRWIYSPENYDSIRSLWTPVTEGGVTGEGASKGSYALFNDITLSDGDHDLTRVASTEFTGYFSGEGNTITIDRSYTHARFFRSLFPLAINPDWDASAGREIPTIRDLNLVYGSHYGNAEGVGPVAGQFTGYMKNVKVISGEIDTRGLDYRGGLVGKVLDKGWFVGNTVESFNIENLTATGSNKGNHIGGLVGGAVCDAGVKLDLKFENNTVTTLTVDADSYQGGLMGSAIGLNGSSGESAGNVTVSGTNNTTTSVTLTGDDNLGGLIGYVKGGDSDSGGGAAGITITGNTLGTANITGSNYLSSMVGQIRGGGGGDSSSIGQNGGSVVFTCRNNTTLSTTIHGTDNIGHFIGYFRAGDGGFHTSGTSHGNGGFARVTVEENTADALYISGQDYLGGMFGALSKASAQTEDLSGTLIVVTQDNLILTLGIKGREYTGGFYGFMDGVPSSGGASYEETPFNLDILRHRVIFRGGL